MAPHLTRRSALGIGLTSLIAGGSLIASSATAAGTSASGYAPVQRTNIDRPVPVGATLLPGGRLVSPAGATYGLGDFPLSLAVSPDGTTAVATGVGQGDGTGGGGFEDKCVDGQRKGTCGYDPIGNSATPASSPDEALFVTNLAKGTVATLRGPKTQCVPGSTTATFSCFEAGVVWSPDGSHVYASGGGNDAVYDFPVTAATGAAGADTVASQPARVTYLQELNGAPSSSATYQSPKAGTAAARTKGMALSPDGKFLFVVKEQAGVLDILRTSDLTLIQEVTFAGLNPTGANGAVSFPYAVAASPDGTAVYVSLQGLAAMATIKVTPSPVTGDLVAAAPVPTSVGANPTGLAVSPNGTTVMVANSNDDTVAIVNTATGLVSQQLTIRAVNPSPNGSVPNAVTFASPTRAYVAMAGDNALAVLDLGVGGWSTSGFVPTGWYPTGVATRSDGSVLALAAKGYGSQYTAAGGYPRAPIAGGPQALTPGYYDGNNMPGLLSMVPAPTAGDLVASTSTVQRNITFMSSGALHPTGSPIPATPGGPTPITHVVYIVRENRTYDQVYGDLAKTRNDVDADPAFQSLASATPNGHAIVNRFASSDSFFSNGEASVQGHWWTAAANTNDYVEKSWRQYYSSRSHTSDEITANTAYPKNCSLFQAAQTKAAANPNFTYKDYGEPVGAANPQFNGSIPGTSAVGTTPAGTLPNPCAAVPAANIDPQNFSSFLGRDDRQFAGNFLTDNGLNPDGSLIGAGTGTTGQGLRNFSYVELPGDHTTGFTPQGAGNIDGHTPRAQIAENDAAVGNIVASLSRSKYWSSTAVFMVEDDSQDGPDHVDGHRNVLLVASPYAQQQSANSCYPGYVSHVHQDQTGVIRTIENVLGMPPLSSYDQNATPLYDLFQNKNDASQLTAADLAPYAQPAPATFVEEKVGDPSAGTAARQAALRAESAHLNLASVDKAGPVLESVLWHSTTNAPMPGELAGRVANWQIQHHTAPSAVTAATLADVETVLPQATPTAPAAPAPTSAACTPTVAAIPPVALPENARPALFALIGSVLVVGGGALLVRRRRITQ